MINPYEVLGIKEGASSEEIKAAYKEMVKKYHPDRHHDNPLYELAEEKLREVNEAYEILMKSGSGTGSGSYRASSSGNFSQVRMDLDRGNLARAEATLNGVADRNAEWHFLYGVLQLKKGWYDDAMTFIQQAVSMEPSNMEYRQALNNMVMRAGNFRTASYSRGYSNQTDELCRMMQCCCCANLLFDCC